ncbi:pollen-specific leucine-rich repeat extensin-like protein 4 [Iris pallida]|uniref:Pollen-specific leucine-rich repeat extensin-like protein 4 n=1 Tax=Iris pallida TaxID=29817 RepID=A0AAX6FKJ5_IRIPA|nr:pollen-specific leucine-rich repeat extensin-like protein 4 [Iris pallida]
MGWRSVNKAAVVRFVGKGSIELRQLRLFSDDDVVLKNSTLDDTTLEIWHDARGFGTTLDDSDDSSGRPQLAARFSRRQRRRRTRRHSDN